MNRDVDDLRAGQYRTAERSTFTFTIKVESDDLDGGWVASVVDLPGCMSQGETREEALENVIDAFREISGRRTTAHILTVLFFICMAIALVPMVAVLTLWWWAA